MININFIKTLTVGVALATAFYPQAFAAESIFSDSAINSASNGITGLKYYESYTDPVSGEVVHNVNVFEGSGVFDGRSIGNIQIHNIIQNPDDIYIPKSFSVIKHWIPMNVSAQLTVQIPDSIVAIGPDAFSDLGYTPNIQFGDDTKIEYISQRAFLGTNVTDVMSIIPDTIKGQSSFEVTEYGNTFVYPYEIYSTEEEPSTLYLAGYQEVNKNVYYVSFDCTDGYCGYHKREYGTTKEYEPINAVPMLSNIFEEGKVESMNYQAKSGVVIKNIMNENPIYAEILRKDLLRTYNTRAVSEAKIGNFEYMFSPAYQMHGTPRAVEKTKPKRLYYTPAEAAQHVNHTNNNKITFTFK